MSTPKKPVANKRARTGCLGLIVIVIIIVVIVDVTGGSGEAPSHFTVSNNAVVGLTTNVINNTEDSPGLNGTPTASCQGRGHCQIIYTVKEPSGISTDLELIQPTAQIWKGLFEDPNFQGGTIEVKGPTTSVGGKSGNSLLFTLSCDRSAASQIDWNHVDGNGLRTLCLYNQTAKGL